MKNKIIFIVIALLLVGVGLYVFTSFDKKTCCADQENAVISDLITNWKAIQRDIYIRPVMGATDWNYPDTIQFISPDTIFISYEDGHIVGHAVMSYREGTFVVLKVYEDENFRETSVWEAMRAEFGDASFTPVVYKFSSTREGSIVYPSDWKKVK